MKTLTTIITVMVLALSIGAAYADEFPTMNSKDVGTELYLNVFGTGDSVVIKDFAVIGERSPSVPMEIGTALYHDAFLAKATGMAPAEARGAAAGGVAKYDGNTRIWDDLLSPSKGLGLE